VQRGACVLAVALGAAFLTGTASAHVGEPGVLSLRAQASALRAASLETAKLDGRLAQVALTSPQARERVVVEPRASVGAARAAVVRAGGFVERASGGLLLVRIRAAALPRLSRDAVVRRVRPPIRPVPASIADEGVDATNATAWHEAGLTGKGVKIAIIDDGFAHLTDRQASGQVTTRATTVDFCSGKIGVDEHGTAVAEIVSQEAPDAELLLLCVDNEVGLDAAEKYAKSNGASIITMSLSWYGTWSGDGKGPPGTPDATVADARAAGILWVNSAGNDAVSHWSGTYVDANGDGFADIGPNADPTDSFVIPGGSFACAFLRWDGWPQATQDYDMYLVREPSRQILARSVNNQHDLHDAGHEELCGVNGGFGSIPVGLVITTAYPNQGPSPTFDLFLEGEPYSLRLEYATAGRSITDPAAAPGALAVGAICWQSTGLEFYSSQGPTVDGRMKPDLVAPDSVSSSTYGQFTRCGGSGFAGTSAAAPHVAGAAALIKQRSPSFKAAQLRAYLVAHAGDLGPPGADDAYGAGRLLLPAIEPPAIGSVTVAGITAHHVRVVVSISPKDSDTRVQLQYGTSKAYGTSTAAQSVSGATQRATVTFTLAGLRAATSYHVRAVLTSTVGTARSADRAFRTATRRHRS
jgi:subtilisin family serine protease